MAVASGVKQAPMHLHTEDGIITPDCGRKITFHNIDYHHNVHYMNEDHQNIDKHYVTYMSTENRVSGNHLSDQTPLGGIKEMENGKCLSTTTDNAKQRQNYIILVERVITTKHYNHVYRICIHDSNNLINQHRTARDYVILSFDGVGCCSVKQR